MRTTASQIRENALNDPAYWVEEINGQLYDAIVMFMEEKNYKRKDLAKHLGISKGRVSQILNSGEINFSLEKIISISLKVGRVPTIKFEKKEPELKSGNYSVWSKFTEDFCLFTTPCEDKSSGCKTRALYPSQENKITQASIGESKTYPLHSINNLQLSQS